MVRLYVRSRSIQRYLININEIIHWIHFCVIQRINKYKLFNLLHLPFNRIDILIFPSIFLLSKYTAEQQINQCDHSFYMNMSRTFHFLSWISISAIELSDFIIICSTARQCHCFPGEGRKLSLLLGACRGKWQGLKPLLRWFWFSFTWLRAARNTIQFIFISLIEIHNSHPVDAKPTPPNWDINGFLGEKHH